MQGEHKIYGSVTVNAKGQIVIPVETRAYLDIKPGDQLIVTSKGPHVIGLIKADNMAQFLQAVEDQHPECMAEVRQLKELKITH